MPDSSMLSHVLKTTLYNLSREYGATITLQKRADTSDFDPETGLQSIDETLYPGIRAIVLPQSVKRSFNYDLSYVAASKNFVYGGFFEDAAIILIIERRSLPAAVTSITGHDYITVDSISYKVSHVEAARDSGYIIGLKTVTL